MILDPAEEIQILRQQLAHAVRRAVSLRDVIEAISGELTLEPLLQRVTECAVELLDAAFGSIGLVEQHNGAPAVRIAAVYNMTSHTPGAVFPAGVGLAGRVLQERVPILIERYGDLDQANLPELANQAVLGLPIWWGEELIGFFGVSCPPPRRFNNDDVDTLALFARHAAIAITNARLFEAERRRAVRTATINRISQLITSSLSLDTIFQNAVEAIHSQLDLTYVAAGVVDRDDPEMLTLLTHAGANTEQVPAQYRQSIHIGLVGAVARSRLPILVNNPADDPRYLKLIGLSQLRATLVLPLVAGEHLLGVLNIESERPIDDDEASDVALIADQLSIALDNARRYDETRLLYETSRRMSTAIDEDTVLATYLEYVASRRRYPCGVMLYHIDALERRIGCMLWGYWTPAEGLVRIDTRLPYIADFSVPLLDAGQTVTISDLDDDPRLSAGFRQYMAEHSWRALAMIPLLVRGERIGIVWLADLAARSWAEADLRPYQITATLLANAIDQRRQHVSFAKHGQQLAVLDERRRLARELHDSVTQSLFSMSLLSQAIPGLWEIDQAEARSSLGQIRDLTRSALAEMRALLFELRPPALGEQDLARALSAHAAAFEQRTGLLVTVEVSGEHAPPEPVEQVLFRVAQEALANVARHAGARSVRIELQAGPPLRLRIADNGRGFTPGLAGEGCFGLVSMRERAATIGAQLAIRSAPGEGAEIVLEWPGVEAIKEKA